MKMVRFLIHIALLCAILLLLLETPLQQLLANNAAVTATSDAVIVHHPATAAAALWGRKKSSTRWLLLSKQRRNNLLLSWQQPQPSSNKSTSVQQQSSTTGSTADLIPFLSSSQTANKADRQSSTKRNVDRNQQLRAERTGLQQQQQILWPLSFGENMICGAVSRTVARTVLYPTDCLKVILQNTREPVTTELIMNLIRPRNWSRLWAGAGGNVLLSIPHGAVNFAVVEWVRGHLDRVVVQSDHPHLRHIKNRERLLGPGLDFLSSTVSTVATSVVSTPHMMIASNIMAGNYPNLSSAVTGLAKSRRGLAGFYIGLWPNLVARIPSYALTWTFFQQLKRTRDARYERTSHGTSTTNSRPAASNNDMENTILGCIASAAAVTLMIPVDTCKTRLVTQVAAGVGTEEQLVLYKGMVDCAVRILREEGVLAFYRGLLPRLVYVVPLTGLQFGAYEFMKKVMLHRRRRLMLDQQQHQVAMSK